MRHPLLSIINTIFVNLREFHGFEKIYFRSSQPDLHRRLENWNLQMVPFEDSSFPICGVI